MVTIHRSTAISVRCLLNSSFLIPSPPPSNLGTDLTDVVSEKRHLKHFEKLVSEHLFSQWFVERPALTAYRPDY